MRVLLLLALAAGAVGCQSDRPAERAAERRAERAARDAAADSLVLALDPDGLRFTAARSGSLRAAAFGTPRDTALALLARVLGDPDETGTMEECGAGPLAYASWADGLTALFDGGAFAGWSVDGRDPRSSRYATVAGLGPGATRAAADSAYALEVSETTLGTEFAAGRLVGLFSGPGADATVTHLWAGTTCAFR